MKESYGRVKGEIEESDGRVKGEVFGFIIIFINNLNTITKSGDRNIYKGRFEYNIPTFA